MNHWTELSIAYAGQSSYLDDLFQIYPTIPEGIRDVDPELWASVEAALLRQDNASLVERLLKQDGTVSDKGFIYCLSETGSVGD